MMVFTPTKSTISGYKCGLVVAEGKKIKSHHAKDIAD